MSILYYSASCFNVQVQKFASVLFTWNPAYGTPLKPAIPVFGDPCIGLLALLAGNGPYALEVLPETRQDRQDFEYGVGTEVEDPAIPDHNAFQAWMGQVLFPEELAGPFGLQGGKAQSIVAVTIEEEFNPANTERTLPIEENDQLIRRHSDLIMARGVTKPQRNFKIQDFNSPRLCVSV